MGYNIGPYDREERVQGTVGCIVNRIDEAGNYVDAVIAEIDSFKIVRPTIAFMTISKGINLTPKIGDFLKGSGAETGYKQFQV